MQSDQSDHPGRFNDGVDGFARLVQSCRLAVVFSGAGISTDSGIPDFRSPDGVWAKRDPVMFADFLQSGDARFEYWSQKAELHPQIRDAQPNIAHKALARWETVGTLRGIVTQNIDGLHQVAGSKNVLELHGTARNARCLDCGFSDDVEAYVQQFVRQQLVPECPECGGRMKHATVSFGQSLPEDILSEAADWSRECDLFVVLGSSLVVHPAAGLPAMARQAGADLVIVNREPTPLDDIATLVINRSIAQTISSVQKFMC